MTSTSAHDRFHETVQNRIKRLRLKSGYSQLALAKEIHLSNNAISNIECCLSWPSMPTTVALAKFFEVSLDYLCCVSDDHTRGERKVYQIRTVNGAWIDCSEEAYTTKLTDGTPLAHLRIARINP
jgi:transcriptional regulator with XRE-family HTH domain